ncbi:MAG: flavin reductase family protein [Chloroflexota bacterium]|nr:flavin reductase family protein [Chloroflexota bacterium]
MSDIFGRDGARPSMMNPEPEGPLALDMRGSRWLRRRDAGGVAALTTVAQGSYRAATISACLIVSSQPLQFLVSVEAESQMESWLQESRIFGISLLSWKQQVLADRFAGFAPLAHRTFRDIRHFTAVSGVPLIEGCIGWADCRIIGDLETGDHRCFVGEAVAIGRGSGEEDDPLVYYLNRYRRLT